MSGLVLQNWPCMCRDPPHRPHMQHATQVRQGEQQQQQHSGSSTPPSPLSLLSLPFPFPPSSLYTTVARADLLQGKCWLAQTVTSTLQQRTHAGSRWSGHTWQRRPCPHDGGFRRRLVHRSILVCFERQGDVPRHIGSRAADYIHKAACVHVAGNVPDTVVAGAVVLHFTQHSRRGVCSSTPGRAAADLERRWSVPVRGPPRGGRGPRRGLKLVK